MARLLLNDNWSVRFEDLSWGADRQEEVLLQEEKWMDVSLPCDIHMPLIENGLIAEPLEQDHSFACEWTEQKSWWFKRSFRMDEQPGGSANAERIELVLESLDAEADIFLNGKWLGHHRSAFYPFRTDVRQQLRQGENVLLVRLSAGVEYVSEMDLARFRDRVGMEKLHRRGERGRIFARKPQYAFGWDWAPRVATCGIVSDVYLEFHERLAIRGVRSVTESLHPMSPRGETSVYDADVRFEIEIEQFHDYSTVEAAVQVNLSYEGQPILKLTKSLNLPSGIHYVDLRGKISDARLWWPNGMGNPDLYTVSVEVVTDEASANIPDFQFGVRTVGLSQDPIGRDERLFAVCINGVRAFCKGANWIPADSVYARVSDEKYRILVSEAKEACFNMLRVWGGGLYERDAFYEACDRNGILIWHDFMFACALYPDDLDWFREEVRREMDYQTRRLRNHASLVLWCGNNENHWGYYLWKAADPREPFFGGAACYNEIAPRIVRSNCPDIPYWNGSPYGGPTPNDERMGDCHWWFDTMMNPDMEKRISPEEYDKLNAKFVSEFGYIGPCRKSTIERYHGDRPLDRNGSIWLLHNNTHEKDTVNAGIAKHYTGGGELDLDRYLLYAGLCQGLMYAYSLEAMRYKSGCSGALFWMYNDCWGEIGWSIIDYELKRKISYYFVKRAFAPIKLIAREAEGRIDVVGINETDRTWEEDAEYGYVSFDGSSRDTERVPLRLPPHSRSVVLSFPKPDLDYFAGCCFVQPIGSGKANGTEPVQAAILRTGDTRNLQLPAPQMTVTSFEIAEPHVRFTVSSAVFAHAVHFGLDDELALSDEYFDLLPGEERTVTVYHASGRVGRNDIRPIAVHA